MDSFQIAITVDFVGGNESPLTVVFRDYEPGDAPVRFENWCSDVTISVFQKLPSRSLQQVFQDFLFVDYMFYDSLNFVLRRSEDDIVRLLPGESQLFTWTAPSRERSLMWSVFGSRTPSKHANFRRVSD